MPLSETARQIFLGWIHQGLISEQYFALIQAKSEVSILERLTQEPVCGAINRREVHVETAYFLVSQNLPQAELQKRLSELPMTYKAVESLQLNHYFRWIQQGKLPNQEVNIFRFNFLRSLPWYLLEALNSAVMLEAIDRAEFKTVGEAVQWLRRPHYRPFLESRAFSSELIYSSIGEGKEFTSVKDISNFLYQSDDEVIKILLSDFMQESIGEGKQFTTLRDAAAYLHKNKNARGSLSPKIIYESIRKREEFLTLQDAVEYFNIKLELSPCLKEIMFSKKMSGLIQNNVFSIKDAFEFACTLNEFNWERTLQNLSENSLNIRDITSVNEFLKAELISMHGIFSDNLAQLPIDKQLSIICYLIRKFSDESFCRNSQLEFEISQHDTFELFVSIEQAVYKTTKKNIKPTERQERIITAILLDALRLLEDDLNKKLKHEESALTLNVGSSSGVQPVKTYMAHLIDALDEQKERLRSRPTRPTIHHFASPNQTIDAIDKLLSILEGAPPTYPAASLSVNQMKELLLSDMPVSMAIYESLEGADFVSTRVFLDTLVNAPLLIIETLQKQRHIEMMSFQPS